jgi:gas vesicle protein
MKYEENEFNTSSGSWLLSFILGGLIGAAVALLLAPKSGRQTREQIKDLAEDAKERAEDYYDKAKSQISTAMQKGAEILEQKKAEVESRVSGIKEAYRKATDTTTPE